MKLEQVKEHFKYAKEVRSLENNRICDLTKQDIDGIYLYENNFWFEEEDGEACMLYDSTTNKLAPILTYIFERGEYVEVSYDEKNWVKAYFMGFTRKNRPVVEDEHSNVYVFNYIRKIQPENLFEPQLSELKKKAESKGMTVNIVFDNSNK